MSQIRGLAMIRGVRRRSSRGARCRWSLTMRAASGACPAQRRRISPGCRTRRRSRRRSRRPIPGATTPWAPSRSIRRSSTSSSGVPRRSPRRKGQTSSAAAVGSMEKPAGRRTSLPAAVEIPVAAAASGVASAVEDMAPGDTQEATPSGLVSHRAGKEGEWLVAGRRVLGVSLGSAVGHRVRRDRRVLRDLLGAQADRSWGFLACRFRGTSRRARAMAAQRSALLRSSRRTSGPRATRAGG